MIWIVNELRMIAERITLVQMMGIMTPKIKKKILIVRTVTPKMMMMMKTLIVRTVTLKMKMKSMIGGLIGGGIQIH